MTPGDHVVLVDDNWSTSRNSAFRQGHYTLPKKGIVYTVYDTSIHQPTGEKHISLCELPQGGPRGCRIWISARRFRKLDRLTPESILAIETRDADRKREPTQ
jgi:hypothetical protein